ncbi:MAG: transcriptional regulator FnrL [Boseongicola sp.]
MNVPTLRSQKCAECPIRHRAVCARCDEAEFVRLEDMKYYRSYEAGQPILWRGDEMAIVASLVRGVASISQTMEDGRRQMVGLLLPSDFIGRPGRERAPYDVTAVTDVTLCCFKRRPFEALVEASPNITKRLLELTLDELDSARDWMLLLGRKTARERIATFIRMVARRSQLPDDVDMPNIFELPLTREAMADYLGLTLETVSRQISALKRDNTIQLHGKRGVEVLSQTRLAAEAGEDAFID